MNSLETLVHDPRNHTIVMVKKVQPELRVVISRRLQEWMRNSPAFDTQAKLAEYSGVSQTTIGRVLHEQTSPTIDTLECLAKTFGRDVVDLVSRPDAGLISYDKAAYTKLPDYEKVRVEGFISHVIKQYNQQ